jgi:hypothetical protein
MFAEDQSSVEVRAPLPLRAPVAALRCKPRPRKQSKRGKFCDLIDVARSHNHLAIAQKQSRTIIITSPRSHRNHLDALHPDMPLAAASSALSKFHIHMITHETSHKNHVGMMGKKPLYIRNTNNCLHAPQRQSALVQMFVQEQSSVEVGAYQNLHHVCSRRYLYEHLLQRYAAN